MIRIKKITTLLKGNWSLIVLSVNIFVLTIPKLKYISFSYLISYRYTSNKKKIWILSFQCIIYFLLAHLCSFVNYCVQLKSVCFVWLTQINHTTLNFCNLRLPWFVQRKSFIEDVTASQYYKNFLIITSLHMVLKGSCHDGDFPHVAYYHKKLGLSRACSARLNCCPRSSVNHINMMWANFLKLVIIQSFFWSDLLLW